MTATAQLEIDLDKVVEAIDRQRRHRKLKRQDVARELGVAPCTLSSWGYGGGIGANAILRVCHWLHRDITTFARSSEES